MMNFQQIHNISWDGMNLANKSNYQQLTNIEAAPKALDFARPRVYPPECHETLK